MGRRFPTHFPANSAGDVPASRHLADKESPLPAPSTIQPDDYADALERADAGIRLALPQFAERVGISEKQAPAPEPIVHEVATEVASRLLTAHEAILGAGKKLPLAACADLHVRFNGLLNEIDQIGVELAGRWSA